MPARNIKRSGIRFFWRLSAQGHDWASCWPCIGAILIGRVVISWCSGPFVKGLTSTKTSKVRRVDMSEQLACELERLYSQRKRQGLRAGKGKPEEIIFHTKGGYTSQNSIRNVWLRVLGKAGFRHRRFHDIRHTFASLLLSNGESPVYVKEQLGHSSIQMTVDVYGHLIPSGNRKAVDRLDAKTPIIANSGNGCI